MIERKIEIEKDNVIKSIDENLVSLYLNMGWSKVENKKEETVKSETKESTKKLFKKE